MIFVLLVNIMHFSHHHFFQKIRERERNNSVLSASNFCRKVENMHFQWTFYGLFSFFDFRVKLRLFCLFMFWLFSVVVSVNSFVGQKISKTSKIISPYRWELIFIIKTIVQFFCHKPSILTLWATSATFYILNQIGLHLGKWKSSKRVKNFSLGWGVWTRSFSQEKGGLEREDFLEYFPYHIKGFVDLTLCGLDKVECFGQISIAAWC